MDFTIANYCFNNEYELIIITKKIIKYLKRYLLMINNEHIGINCVHLLINLKKDINQYVLTNQFCKNCHKVLKPINIIIIRYRKKIHMLCGHDPINNDCKIDC